MYGDMVESYNFYNGLYNYKDLHGNNYDLFTHFYMFSLYMPSLTTMTLLTCFNFITKIYKWILGLTTSFPLNSITLAQTSLYA